MIAWLHQQQPIPHSYRPESRECAQKRWTVPHNNGNAPEVSIDPCRRFASAICTASHPDSVCSLWLAALRDRDGPTVSRASESGVDWKRSLVRVAVAHVAVFVVSDGTGRQDDRDPRICTHRKTEKFSACGAQRHTIEGECEWFATLAEC